ncbi:MAG: 2Fe-2S iron-sulfur cluster binding domain-containing protein [Candidatus Sericytochromatia bacterium]
MPSLNFKPHNKKVEFLKNKTVLEIAFQNEIYVPSLCEEGACSVCMVKVLNGKEYLKEGSNINVGDDILACISTLKEDYLEREIEIEIDIQEI